MGKPVISNEWTICDSDAEWESVQTQPSLHTAEKVQAARFGMRRFRWSAATAALLVLAITGAWLWRTAQTGLNQIDAELSAAVAQEMWAVGEGKASLAADLATGSRDAELQRRLKRDYALLEKAAAGTSTEGEILTDMEIVRLLEDQAVVRVLIEIGDEKYRQTRFYRRTSEGWLQIPPSPDLLGKWRRLETAYLSIGYFELDAAAAAEAAPRLDAFVAQMQADLGISGVESQARHEIEIVYKDSLGRAAATNARIDNVSFRMSSPLPQFMPAAISESEAIAQSAVTLLADSLVQEALYQEDEQRTSTARLWLPLFSALRLWEFWESGAPLARWRHEIVEMGVQPYTLPDDIPAHYGDICHAYRVWNLSPWSMSVPLWCKSSEREPYFALAMPNTLHGLLTPGMDCCETEGVAKPEAYKIGLTTVLDYAVATYGRKQLPVLVGALVEHERWETLIPAVFGVSMEEFESGWQAYLAEHYR